MKHHPKPGYPGLFIDDLDPYADIGDAAIPVPASVELDTQEAWDDFQDSVAAFAAPDEDTQTFLSRIQSQHPVRKNRKKSDPPGGGSH